MGMATISVFPSFFSRVLAWSVLLSERSHLWYLRGVERVWASNGVRQVSVRRERLMYWKRTWRDAKLCLGHNLYPTKLGGIFSTHWRYHQSSTIMEVWVDRKQMMLFSFARKISYIHLFVHIFDDEEPGIGHRKIATQLLSRINFETALPSVDPIHPWTHLSNSESASFVLPINFHEIYYNLASWQPVSGGTHFAIWMPLSLGNKNRFIALYSSLLHYVGVDDRLCRRPSGDEDVEQFSSLPSW